MARQPTAGLFDACRTDDEMPSSKFLHDHLHPLRHALRWCALAAPVAVAVGSAVALFLWLLDRATRLRWENPWLLWLLPVAGAAIACVYDRHGKDSHRGNNLVIEQIHEPGGGVPKRMAPLVLAGTVLTHLFGGSAGREGTAVQMGGSIAQAFVGPFRLGREDTSVLLMCGVAAGFGAVFGTPLAGAVFALEVLALGRLRYDGLVPCLVAAFIADRACLAWGIGHTHYAIAPPALADGRWAAALQGMLALKVALAAVAFGLASALFVHASHLVQGVFEKRVALPWLRPAIGGCMVIALAWILGTRDYLGLGVATEDGTGVSIINAFREGGATPWSWLWKTIFTAITLGSGFKGGEVTPLFFVGATLGCVLGSALGVPVDLMAGLGFVAVFAGATKTPLACTIMGIELFGAAWLPHIALACFVACAFGGGTSIYRLRHRQPPDAGDGALRKR